MSFFITDWAGNILSHDGRFKPVHLATPKLFKTFDDGIDYMHEFLDDGEMGTLDDYSVVKLVSRKDAIK